MGIFDRFPYSSTHEMNLDFMLGKATEIAEDMQQVTAGMEQVQAGLTAISEKTEQATQAAAQAAASASSIEGSVTAAEEAAEEAQMHNESAQTWANNALTYKADCQRAATEAAASSSSAAQAATAAAASEDTVAQYAQAANASAQSAANNNDSAHQYANQASASASNATFHSSNAQTAATNANTSATNAETAATNAQTAATRTAALKDDCETLHRMCTAAVDQAATEAVNAANSAAQAAATKTDVETLVKSLPEDFTDLNNTVNQLSDEIDDLKKDTSDVLETFDTNNTILTGTIVSGKLIRTDGTEAVSSDASYEAINITDDLIGTLIFVDGTSWYSMKPYVFVPTNGTPIAAPVEDATTPIQYNNLEFTPDTTGTLYVQRHTNMNPSHKAEAYYKTIANIKKSYIPFDIQTDAVQYKVITLEMTNKKLISASTGVISDTTNDEYKVSQYIDVAPNTPYLISTEQFWSQGMYVWFDSNKKYISGVEANPGGTITKIYCEKVISPSNARYLVIGYLYQGNFPFPFLMEGEMNSITPSKRWSGKKWTCIGDSLTEAYTVTGAHYFDLISAATGIETVNKGVSGTGYARGTDNFMARALTVPTDSDVVTFFGSGNDSGAGLELGTASDTGTETIGGCINTAIDNLYSIMPVVQLGIVTPTPWQGNMPSDNGWMSRYSALIVEICNRRSIPCLDLFHCSNLNPNSAEVRQIAYARDNGGGVHPSEVGHAIIAPRFLAFLESLLMH